MSAESKVNTSGRSRFVLLNNPPSLKKIATFQIALTFWKHYCPKGYHLNKKTINLKSLFDIELYHITQAIPYLPLPNITQEFIKQEVRSVSSEIKLWLHSNDHHDYKLNIKFFTPFTFFTHVEDLVWNGNLIIDYEKTVDNMLGKASHLLDPEQQFVIASMYCMENLIHEIRDPEWKNIQSQSIYDFRENMVQYWLNRDLFDDSFDAACMHLLHSMPSIRNTSAYCYFWNRLLKGWRRNYINLTILHSHPYPLQYFLGNMTEKEWIQLILENGSKLIINLMQNEENPEHIFQIWNYTKDMFDDDEFIKLMSFDIPSRMRCCASRYDCIHKDFWISAPRRLQHDTLDRLLSDAEFLKIKGFLKLLLKLANDEQKTHFLQKHAISIICTWMPSKLSNLIHSCFSYRHIEKFRKQLKFDFVSILHERLYHLFVDAELEEIEFFLRWLSYTPTEVIDVKKTILKISSNPTTEYKGHFHFYSFDELKALDKFILQAFQYQPEHVDKYRFELVCALVNLQLCTDILRDANTLPKITQFIDFFMSSEHPAYRQIKSKLLDMFRNRIEKGNFYPVVQHLPIVDQFVSWCLGNNGITDFKKSLPLAQIHSSFTIKCLSRDPRDYYSRNHSFRQFDCFRQWCISGLNSSLNHDEN